MLAKWRFYVKVPYRLLIKKEKKKGIILVNSFGKGSYCSKVLTLIYFDASVNFTDLLRFNLRCMTYRVQ